jgi:hypothetical protein
MTIPQISGENTIELCLDVDLYDCSFQPVMIQSSSQSQSSRRVPLTGLTAFHSHPLKDNIAIIHSSKFLFFYSFHSSGMGFGALRRAAWFPSHQTGSISSHDEGGGGMLLKEGMGAAHCLAWNPFAPATLAIGTSEGVVLICKLLYPPSVLRGIQISLSLSSLIHALF